MRFIAFVLLDIHLVFAGMHSVQFFCTVVSKGINLPMFTVVGLVDDLQFMYFDSNTMKAVPKTEWMRPNKRADHWDKQTQIFIGYYKEYKNTMYHLMDLFSHNMADVHTFQIMCGCELDDDEDDYDDDTNQGYYKFGYDGEDFISFDNNTISWSAASAQTDIIKNKWEAKAKYWKTCLKNTCTESLKKYLSYGNDTLERKVSPKVSLLQKNSSSPVICHATGFYPKNITMTWIKNHKKLCKDVNISSTLPNGDGTFQKSISLLMKPEKWKKNPDVYRCVIQHVAAKKKFIVTLNENKSKSDYDNIIAHFALAVGLVVAAASFAAIIVYILRKMPGDGPISFCLTDTDRTEISEQADAELFLRDPSNNSRPRY